MKKIILILVLFIGLFLTGCEKSDYSIDSRPGKGDNVPGTISTYPQISVTDCNDNTMTFDYARIWMQDGQLNIEFPECGGNGCGVTYIMTDVKSFSTTLNLKK